MKNKFSSKPSMLALCVALACSTGSMAVQAAPAGTPAVAPRQASGAFWQEAGASEAANIRAKNAAIASMGSAAPSGIAPRRFRAVTLDKAGMRGFATAAPLERSVAAQSAALTISLPHPDGGFQRFTLVESPIMEAGLAAKHPEIQTFAGKGIDDPSASMRMDITPLGLHASIRSPNGAWYIDPHHQRDDSLHLSYHARDLPNPHGPLREGALDEAQIVLTRGFYHAADAVEVRGVGFVPGASVSVAVRNPETDFGPVQNLVGTADENGVLSVTIVADPTRNTGAYEITATDGRSTSSASYQVVGDEVSPSAAVGTQLRTYRLALVTDPSYASYFGAANVTSAKVSLINRVTQVYEDETSIRLVLIDATDALNLNTADQMTGANGPCGGAACFTTTQASGCASSTLTRNRQVVGLLAGAANYDVGHIAFGLNGGGVASLGVVGGNNKAQGCTGIPTPVGDYFAVDYVAHELGHQFAGNHTFNGVVSNCSGGNRNAGTSVEPGSGSSIMAYAGICGTDNLQTHSDAYWSQRSFDEIVAFTSGVESNINEVQLGVLAGFATNGQQFRLQYKGNQSAPIVLGTNYTTAGVKAAVEAIPGWPAGGTVTVSALSNTAFTVTFGGALAATSVAKLQLQDCSAGCSGYVGQVAAGGQSARRGAVTATGGSAPSVSAPVSYIIPVRTPFALTGSASNISGDPMTFMWEQNDRAAGTGTGLISNTKLNGPLFRQFGVRAVVSNADTLEYGSAGENLVTTIPTRVFPDMAQILANNTNAVTGSCPVAAVPPSAADMECYSEFLPTASYVGFAGTNASPASLNFRLTARDGRGGVASAGTQLVLAPGAGPFLVTSPNTAVVLDGGSLQTVTWSVANTAAAPVNEANVKISLSTDGGETFPHVLAASTPNTGSKAVTLPMVGSTAARIKIEALTNVFFDVSNANFTLRLVADVNGDSVVDCDDLAIVKAAMGKRAGQAGFDARADLNKDGVVDIRDLSVVAKALPAGSVCK
ncbi:MAG: M12 family metallo-peptidase [Pseudomonadota bacterium]